VGTNVCKGLCSTKYADSNVRPKRPYRLWGGYFAMGFRYCRVCEFWWSPKSVLLKGVRCCCCGRMTSRKPSHGKRNPMRANIKMIDDDTVPKALPQLFYLPEVKQEFSLQICPAMVVSQTK